MYQSILQEIGPVPFPQFASERVYMRRFRPDDGLPPNLQHWQPTVDAMLAGVKVPNHAYLMIDQSLVPVGQPQRRPGLHIDGYWVESLNAHTGGGGHTGNGGHKTVMSNWDHGWVHTNFSKPEAIILASDVSASRALTGTWDGVVGEGGDCSHISTDGLQEVPLRNGIAYAGNVTMLHESLPVRETCARTLVRLNVPGWEPRN